MIQLLRLQVLFVLLIYVFVISCKKASTENANGSNPGSGSNNNSSITETITSFKIEGQPFAGTIEWLGMHAGILYGQNGSTIFRINPTTKTIEQVFRINFPGSTVSQYAVRSVVLTANGELIVSVKAQGANVLVARMTLDGQKIWTKRISFSLNQYYQERHIENRNIQVFDDAVWLTCQRMLVKLNLQTGAVLASTQLPFAAADYTTPNNVMPAGNYVMVHCRNSYQHLDLFFFDKNTLSFSHSIGRKVNRSGVIATSFSTNNVFPLPNNKLLFLSKYTHNGSNFFPMSFAMITDYEGNVERSFHFSNHLNNLVNISSAIRHSNGRYYAMLESQVDANYTYTYNIISVDEQLNLLQSVALPPQVGKADRNTNDVATPFPIDATKVVLCNGTSFLYWIDYRNIGCSKDTRYTFSVPQMEMLFTPIVRSTTPPSYAPGLSIQSTADADISRSNISFTQTNEECKK